MHNLKTVESENDSIVATHIQYYLHELFQEMFTSTALPVLAATLYKSRNGIDQLFQEITPRTGSLAAMLKCMQYDYHLWLCLQQICWEDMHVLFGGPCSHTTEDWNILLISPANWSRSQLFHTAPLSVTSFD